LFLNFFVFNFPYEYTIHGGLLAINEVSEIVLQFNGLSIFNILDNLAAVKARMVQSALKAAAI
jgi:hypothetical protein